MWKGDIDWYDLPYTSGIQAGTAAKAQVAREGDTIFFRGGGHIISGTFENGSNQIVPAGGVPAWARPTQHIRFGATGTARRVAGMIITMHGEVSVLPDPTGTMPTWIAGATSFKN